MHTNDKAAVLVTSKGTYIIVSCLFILVAVPFVILTLSGHRDASVVLCGILTVWSVLLWSLTRLRIVLTDGGIEYRSAITNLKIAKNQLIALKALYGRKNMPIFALVIETTCKTPKSKIPVSMKFFSKSDIRNFLDFAYDLKVPVFVDDAIVAWIKQKA